MKTFAPAVLEQLRQSMVIFTIGKKDRTMGWGSGFACFPDKRAVLTCMHNFVGAIPEYVIARHTMSEERYKVPSVVWSNKLDCAIAVLDRPLSATPLSWAETLSKDEPVAIPDYVRGSDSNKRFDVAWKGKLEKTWLRGITTDRICKAANWVGSPENINSTRAFDVRGAHPGLSGSPIINHDGYVVGQVTHLEDDNAWNALNSHFLEELKINTAEIYAKAREKGLLE